MQAAHEHSTGHMQVPQPSGACRAAAHRQCRVGKTMRSGAHNIPAGRKRRCTGSRRTRPQEIIRFRGRSSTEGCYVQLQTCNAAARQAVQRRQLVGRIVHHHRPRYHQLCRPPSPPSLTTQLKAAPLPATDSCPRNSATSCMSCHRACRSGCHCHLDSCLRRASSCMNVCNRSLSAAKLSCSCATSCWHATCSAAGVEGTLEHSQCWSVLLLASALRWHLHFWVGSASGPGVPSSLLSSCLLASGILPPQLWCSPSFRPPPAGVGSLTTNRIAHL